MIMVRRNELACRDEWSRSLWAPAEPGQHVEDSAFHRPASVGPAAPAGADDLKALARAEEASASQGEDVLLSEARIVSEHHEPPVPHTPPQGNFDPRTAVFRARERYRDRNRAKESAARQSGAAIPIIVGVAGANDTDFGPGEDLSSELGAAVQSLEPTAPRDSRDFERRPAISVAAPEPAPDYAASAAVMGQSDLVGNELAVMASDETSLARFLATTEVPAAEPDEAHHPELALESLAAIDERELPAWFRTDLPRICRTCRDYRPSADGRRGWCANRWAFTNLRMVQDDEPVPCDSSIGDWWVAVDDVWLVAADVSAHGRATPLLDRMTGRIGATRKRS